MYTIFSILQNLLFIAIGVGGISALVFIHEFGHYLFCKLFSIKTPSFSIGFGPRLYSKRMWDTDFVISAIPLGGYVEIAGLAEVGQGEQQEAFATGSYAFSEKPYYQKILTLLGGIIFNLLFAYIVFIGIHFFGAPAVPLLYIETATTRVAQVQEGSPAEQAGIKEGDILESIDKIELNGTTTLNGSIESLANLIKDSKHAYSEREKQVTLKIERNGSEQLVHVSIPDASTTCSPYLGIIFEQKAKPPVPLLQAIKKGIESTHRWIKRVALSYMQLFKKCDTSSMGGPIKIISMITQSANDGLLVFFLFLSIISINLAVFNLIPVPILDGGQIFIQTIETLAGRPLPLKVREWIFAGTWIVFLILTVYLSFYDIKALISPYLTNIQQWFH